MSLFSGSQMKIYSITVDKPRIHALVNKDGKTNWDITKPDTTSATTEEPSAFSMKLNHYKINDGYIKYADIPGDMSAEITHLNHSGSGDFTSDLFTLSTSTSAESVNFVYTKIPYLSGAKASLDADIQVDNKQDKYTFKTDDVVLNDLKLSTAGYFQFVNDSTYGMDISFKAPSTEFKTLLSLIPAVYKNDFDKIKTNGKAIFNGNVKGEYNAVKIPSYHINLNVENGFFQYPDLPQPVKNINIAMKVDNPDGVTDNTVVDISKGHIEFGNDPFDFRLLLQKPVTDQYIDANVKGKLDLAQVTKFVKLSGDTKLSGLLDADATAKGNIAVITQQKPGPFTANGFINLTNLNYSSKDFPQPVRNSNIQIKFDNPDGVPDHTVINVPVAHVEIGSNPIDFNVLLKTPATDPYFDGKAKGKFDLASASQFTTLEPGMSVSGMLNADIAFRGNKSSIDKSQYDKINTSGTLTVTNLDYKSKDYPNGVKVSDAAFTFNPKNITLNTLKAEYLKSHITANGSVGNALGYMLKDEPIAGTLNITADKVNLNDFMGTSASATTDTATTTSASPFEVPKCCIYAERYVDKLIYDKVEYDNLKGTVSVESNCSAERYGNECTGGNLSLSGYYSTKTNKKTPDISLSYDIKELDAEKTL